MDLKESMSGMMLNGGLWLVGTGLWTLAGTSGAAEVGLKNRYAPYSQVTNITEGISWPRGQALPIFSTPAEKLDCLLVQELSKDEQLTFSALQGLVNRKQPRIFLLDGRSDEGPYTWANTSTVGLENRNMVDRKDRYEMVAKYAKEVEGVILYNPALSPHYRNLAGTAASQKRALPVIPEIYEEMKKKGVNLPVLLDLTKMELTQPVEIYNYMYENFWPKSEKRLLVSAKPHDQKGGGDYHHTRDIAAAAGAAVVWLDTLIPEEKAVLRKFMGDMKAGEAIILGWYSTERSGITTASEFGIGTLPADFYVSGSVYSGTDHKIQIPPVPRMPELQDKVYVALFISDGDNIQYTQHAMRKLWDRITPLRGKMPFNWSIAPGLVDIGPGIMNYYYTTATPNDCFVTGPSGMGYMMPYNTLMEPGAPVGEYLKDPARMDGYARLTETYLQRAGIRVITIWDDATPMHRKSYENHCRNLYGATVQNFKDVPSVASSVENNRVRFDKLGIAYAGSYNHIHGFLDRELKRWGGSSPEFLSYQVDVWGEMKPEKVIELRDNIEKEYPGKVEFVRADHYFNLYNEANGLPFNLCMRPGTSVRTGDSAAVHDAVMDGTPSTVWTASKSGQQWLGFDFGKEFRINRYVIKHAGDGGLKPSLNSKDVKVQASLDGQEWKTVNLIKDNKNNVNDVDFPAMQARYVKVFVSGSAEDSKVRIADVEIYGSK